MTVLMNAQRDIIHFQTKHATSVMMNIVKNAIRTNVLNVIKDITSRMENVSKTVDHNMLEIMENVTHVQKTVMFAYQMVNAFHVKMEN